MADLDNLFNLAIARADSAILSVMGAEGLITSGALSGTKIPGVFEDPENIAYPGSGVRVEGTSPSLFVKSSSVSQLQRLDTLVVNGVAYWVDRIGPDDCGSRHLWLGTGSPPANNRRR